jgi:hypothetical protein
MADENVLLNKAIAHANRAEELAREGFLEVADLHDSIANTFRSLAHEVRVGKSKRKYEGVSETFELPYTMTNELRGAEKDVPPPTFVSNYFGAQGEAPRGIGQEIPGVPGGFMQQTEAARVAFGEDTDADHEVDGDSTKS